LATGTGTLLDPKFSPDGRLVSYVRDHDLYVYDLAAGKERAVTTGGSERKTHGLAEFVAQEEMRRYTGYWWAPHSKRSCWEEADAEGVETGSVAAPPRPEQPPLPQLYPRPGHKNVRVRLAISKLEGGEPLWVKLDPDFEYVAQVRWDKKGPLTVVQQDRLQ